MPRVQFTDLSLRALKADVRTDFWDSKTPSFGVRVGKSTKTFMVKLNNRRIRIGRYPAISLHDARRRALALKSEATPSPVPDTTFAEAVELFLSTFSVRPSTARQTARALRVHFLSRLRTKKLALITTHDVTSVFDQLIRRGVPGEANHAFKYARTFFRWAARRKLITISPLSGQRMPARENARDRVLSDAELRSIWRAAQRAGYPFGTIVQLLILTGQRRGEIAALRWSFIDTKARIITFPASLTKNNRMHELPYNGMVAEILETIPRFNSTNLLFLARAKTDTPFNGWSKSKENLENRPPIRPWTLHDLRRTFATHLAALGVRIEVTERLLNHISGTHGGLVGIYQRHSWKPEMRTAIETWEASLCTLLES